MPTASTRSRALGVGSRNPKSPKYTKVSEDKIQEFRDKGMAWALRQMEEGKADEEHQEAVRRMYPSAYKAIKAKQPEKPETSERPKKQEEKKSSSRPVKEQPRSRARNMSAPPKAAIERRFKSPEAKTPYDKLKKYEAERKTRGYQKKYDERNPEPKYAASSSKGRTYSAWEKYDKEQKAKGNTGLGGLVKSANDRVSTFQKTAGPKFQKQVSNIGQSIGRAFSGQGAHPSAAQKRASEAGRILAQNRKLASSRKRTGMSNTQLRKMS